MSEAVLDDKVALVTGASRGVGKGIAIALGEAGATVYVTGRSTLAGGSTGSLPGTVEETAEAVTAGGGTGVAVACAESPAFVGRAVVALAADPDVLARSGRVLVAAELAEEYGFGDVDGSRPTSLRSQFEAVS